MLLSVNGICGYWLIVVSTFLVLLGYYSESLIDCMMLQSNAKREEPKSCAKPYNTKGLKGGI